MKSQDRIKRGLLKPKKPKKGEEGSVFTPFHPKSSPWVPIELVVLVRLQSSPQVIRVMLTYLFLTSRGESGRVSEPT